MEPLISSVQWEIFILLCLNVTITLCCKPIAQMDAKANVKTDVKAEANVDIMENLAKMVGIEKGAFDGFIKSGAFKGIEAGGVTGMQSGAISILKNMREVVGMQSGAVVGMESGAVDIDTHIITDIKADFGGVMVGIIAIAAMGGFIIMFSIAACLIKKIINKISQSRNRNKKNLQGEDSENDSSKKSTTQQKIIFGVIILTVLGCYVFLFLSMNMIAEVSKRNTMLKTQVKLNAYFIEFFSMNGQLEEIEKDMKIFKTYHKLISQNQIEIQGLQNELKEQACSSCMTTPSRPDKNGNPSKGNKKCIIPFTFNGKAYSSCAPGSAASNIQDDSLWCSTKVDSKGELVLGEWGFCSQACSGCSVCMTTPSRLDKNGRPSKGNKKCIFPFTFNGKTYSSCAPGSGASNIQDDSLWCSTKVDSKGKLVLGEWGFCSQACSGRSRSGHVRSGVELIPSKRSFGNVTKTAIKSTHYSNQHLTKLAFKTTTKYSNYSKQSTTKTESYSTQD